jgi:Kdo2-lipid IVA lauroyltransferase/acyltransferase
MREWLEYLSAWAGLKALGILPRQLARFLGAQFAAAAFALRPGLRTIAAKNLELAFPDMTESERRRIVRNMVRQVGWMAGEFSQLPRYSRKNIEKIVVLDGLENFQAARKLGKGVLFLTGHMSAWELAPFAQALYGNPLHFLVRPVTNSRVDDLINHYRCLSGNQPVDKNRSARAILKILAQGGTVGILSDHNTAGEEGIFVNFFGIPAATTSGLARIALRTDAAVVPGFLAWDENLRKYRLGLQPAVPLIRTGDEEFDVRENTARFNRIIEDCIRNYPDQWFWLHKRWKTRPPGAEPLYSI